MFGAPSDILNNFQACRGSIQMGSAAYEEGVLILPTPMPGQEMSCHFFCLAKLTASCKFTPVG